VYTHAARLPGLHIGSAPGTPKMYSMPSFSSAAMNRSEAFEECPRTRPELVSFTMAVRDAEQYQDRPLAPGWHRMFRQMEQQPVTDAQTRYLCCSRCTIKRAASAAVVDVGCGLLTGRGRLMHVRYRVPEMNQP